MSATRWLLTGGAGYIGAHVLRTLQQQGHEVVVLDDLSTGEARKVSDAAVVTASVLDQDAVTAALREHRIDGVVHLAAKKAVGESVAEPHRYFRENVVGMMSLLDAMRAADVHRMVLSSSAAVYGEPASGVAAEDDPLMPTNPYGQTKLAQEWLLHDAAPSGHELSWVALRYFNVAGAGAPDLGDTGVHNLVPLVLRALTSGAPPLVFGDDYPTDDGTCVRDYIHVQDLADAHAVAVAATEDAGRTDVLNVGTGRGASVLEVVAAVQQATGLRIEPRIVERRPGDPARLIADATRITTTTPWRPQHDLAAIAASAWEAWQAHPPAA